FGSSMRFFASGIAWTKHKEYDENVIHIQYRPLHGLGLSFGAQDGFPHYKGIANTLQPLRHARIHRQLIQPAFCFEAPQKKFVLLFFAFPFSIHVHFLPAAAASKIKSDTDGEIREVYENAVRMENEVRLVDEMSGELGMVKSDVGKLCLERKELDEKFVEVSRVLVGLSAKERVSVVRMETDALRKQVVNIFLVNYERNTSTEQDDERGEAHHNWVDEVVSSEARGAIIEHDSSYMTLKPQAGNKDPTLLTRLPSFIPLMTLFIYFNTNTGGSS
ncbi:protein EFR3 homolog B, partial [Tanacetum coccineum]